MVQGNKKRSLGHYYENYNSIQQGSIDFVEKYSDIFTLEMGKALRKMNVPFLYGVAYRNKDFIHAFILIDGNDIGNEEDVFLDARGLNTYEYGFWEPFFDGMPYDCDFWFEDPYNSLDYVKTQAEFDNIVSSLNCERLKLDTEEIKDLREEAKKMIANNFYSYFFNIVSGN